MNTFAIDFRENYLLDRSDFLHAALEYPWRYRNIFCSKKFDLVWNISSSGYIKINLTELDIILTDLRCTAVLF